jgi:hypothetical protein
MLKETSKKKGRNLNVKEKRKEFKHQRKKEGILILSLKSMA